MTRTPPLYQAWPLDWYDEDMGPVLWHRFPIEEAPWCGKPHDSDWPGYHTHFQMLPELPVPVDEGATLRETIDALRAIKANLRAPSGCGPIGETE